MPAIEGARIKRVKDQLDLESLAKRPTTGKIWWMDKDWVALTKAEFEYLIALARAGAAEGSKR